MTTALTAALYALLAVGLVVGVFTALLVGYLIVAVHLDKRVEAKRRAEQGREVDAAYIASLAVDPDETSPTYDRLVCESIERAEGWS